MDGLLSVLLTSFTIQTVFGLVGGFLGGIYAMSFNDKYNLTIKTILVVLSGFAGGALADYLNDQKDVHTVLGLGFLGAICGVPVGFVMEGIRVFFPSWFDKFLTKVGDKTLNKIGD